MEENGDSDGKTAGDKKSLDDDGLVVAEDSEELEVTEENSVKMLGPEEEDLGNPSSLDEESLVLRSFIFVNFERVSESGGGEEWSDELEWHQDDDSLDNRVSSEPGSDSGVHIARGDEDEE